MIDSNNIFRPFASVAADQVYHNQLQHVQVGHNMRPPPPPPTHAHSLTTEINYYSDC